MSYSDARGKTVVLLIICSALAFDIIVTILHNELTRTTTILRETLQLLLWGSLYFLLYRGFRWARWVVVTTFLVSGLYFIVVFLRAGVPTSFRGITALVGLGGRARATGSLMVIAPIFFLGASGILVFSTSVNSFLHQQRQRRREDLSLGSDHGA